MKAIAQLHVEDSMKLDVRISMTVQEMKHLLEAIKDARSWPATSLRTILSQTLHTANQQFTAEHPIEP